MVEILQSEAKQSDAEFEGNTTHDILINTLLDRLTLDPAGMHCPAWDDAFVYTFSINIELIDAYNGTCSYDSTA